MSASAQPDVCLWRGIYRFGAFELDASTLELRKHGVRIRMVGQPMQVLLALLEAGGGCVSRDELRNALWPGEAWADLDLRLNKVLNRVRETLGDTAEHPRYIETVPRIGYRFLVPVQKQERPEPSPRAVHGSELASAVEIKHAPPAAPHRRYALELAVVAIVVLLWLVFWFRPSDFSASRILDPEPLTAFVGLETAPAFSPSGDLVAFAWNGEQEGGQNIHVIRLADRSLSRITSGPGRDSAPAWSPDGRQIAFIREHRSRAGTLMLVSADGGTARAVAELRWWALPPRMAWTANGEWIVVPDSPDRLRSMLVLISPKTGERRQLTFPPPESKGDYSPAVSPDGRYLAFTRFVTGHWNDIFILKLDTANRRGAEPRRVTDAKMQLGTVAWLDADQLVFSGRQSGGEHTLYRVQSQPGSVPRDLGNVRLRGTDPAYSLRSGNLAYVQGNSQRSIWSLDLDAAGFAGSDAHPRRIVASSAADDQADFSPDGASVAFTSTRDGNVRLYGAAADGSNPNPIVSFRGGDAKAPRWSPRGDWIAFESRVSGNPQVYLYSPATRETRRLTEGPHENYLPSWSHDGAFVYFCSTRSGASELWKISVHGGRAEQVTTTGGRFGIESPDGSYLYIADASRPSILRTRDLRTGAEEQLITGIVSIPGFAITAGGVYYLKSEKGGGHHLRYLDLATRKDVKVHSLRRPAANGLSISGDDKRILFALTETLGSDLLMLRGLGASNAR